VQGFMSIDVGSGHARACGRQHLAAESDDLVWRGGSGQKPNIRPLIKGALFAVAAQNEYWKRGKARGKLGHECGAAQAGPIESDDHQAKFSREMGIFNEDKGFGGISGAPDVGKVAPQD